MKLGDHTPEYLVKSAEDETIALGRKLDAVLAGADGISTDDRMLLRAYVGSIGARLAVADMKLRERGLRREDEYRQREAGWGEE